MACHGLTKSGLSAAVRSRGPVRPWSSVAALRAVALFFGVFSLANIVGELFSPHFDANYWWIDFRPVPPLVSRAVLGLGAVLLLAYAFRPQMGRRLRVFTLLVVGVLAVVACYNTVCCYVLLASEVIKAGVPIPFSFFVAVALTVLWFAILANRHAQAPAHRLESFAVGAAVLAACAIGFPLAQMLCFGRTDYSRPADAVVVFGARAYADGRLSQALEDRVRTACDLYREGFARLIIVSGGPGDGRVHETAAMKQFAMHMGVPEEAILEDREGVSTRATVRNTCAAFREHGVRRVLAVSHFYHLPRIKMSYARVGQEVYTVPAREGAVLTKLPYLMAREVAALWVYYLWPPGR